MKKIAVLAGCVLLLAGCSGVSARDAEAEIKNTEAIRDACALVYDQDWTNFPIDAMKATARDFVSIRNKVSGLDSSAKETVTQVALLVAKMDSHYDNLPETPGFFTDTKKELEAGLDQYLVDAEVWSAERLSIAADINQICSQYIGN